MILLLLAGGVVGCAPGAPAASSPAPVSSAIPLPDVTLRLPSAVGAFRFVARQDFEDPSQGAMFRFRTSDSLAADVFLYPGPDLEGDCPLDCARRLLESEQKGFSTAMAELKASGRIESYRKVSDASLSRPDGAAWAIGHRIGMRVRMAGAEHQSHFWLVYLAGVRLKVRSTFIDAAGREGALEEFLSNVVEAFVAPAAPAVTRNERPLPDVADRESIFGLLEGRWSWEGGDEECKSVHTLTLSPDRRILDLEYPERRDSAGVTVRVRYRVVEAGPQVLPWAPYAIRMEMEGETRRTDAGALVVWDLVFASRDRYHWHRTDWDDGGLTGAIIRCDAPGRSP